LSALIQDLKNEHKTIISSLNEVTKLGIEINAGQQKLIEVKDSLITHLKKEDELLYPPLWDAAKANINLKNTLEECAQEMKIISKITIEFFEKYSDGGAGLEFVREYGKLYGILGKRINKEESSLYKFYEDLVKR